jgi:catechol 2,3-dioxygenase-like lactoylglutathione lyase family enzyme
MLKPTGLVRGHYECRSLGETLPIFTDLLALEASESTPGSAVVKHPNTDWLLVVHESGPAAPEKPLMNHYGVRVAEKREVDAAWEYITAHRKEYGIQRITRPGELHFAYSFYFKEPGGNYWEIEFYDRAAAGDRHAASPHWSAALPVERFPGKGYMPQALTHGTLECDDKEASARFYREVLGLEIAGGGRVSVHIKHPATPWYIVVIPGRKRHYLSQANRFTLTLASPDQVLGAHREFETSGRALGIMELGGVRTAGAEVSVLFSDLDRNWWEILATRET